MDLSQPLSQPPPSSLNGLMNKLAMMAVMEAIQGLAMWTSHQNWCGYNHCWLPNLPAADTDTESLIPQHSPGWSASYPVAGGLHLTFPSRKRQPFILTRISTYSGYGFAFPACKISAETTIHRLTNALPTYSTYRIPTWYSMQYCLPHGSRPHFHGICWS